MRVPDYYDVGGMMRCNHCNLLYYREDVFLDADFGNICIDCLDEKESERETLHKVYL